MTLAIRVADPLGVHVATFANFVDPVSGGGAAVEYLLSVGNPYAQMILTVPPDTDKSIFSRDVRLGAWRSVAGRPPYLDGEAIWLARMFTTSHNFYQVRAFHANHLLTRRIIAYDATPPSNSSTYTNKKSNPADNIVKAFIRENMGNLITTIPYLRDTTLISDRIQADVSASVPVQADLSQGATVALAATRRKLSDVVTEVGQASTTAGTYLATEIIAPTESTLEARTYVGQRGNDHREGTAQPVIFAVDRGNLENAILTEDYSNEVTVVIAGGQGQMGYRMVIVRADTERITATPFNRIETFLDMSNVSDELQLYAQADARLRAGRPMITLDADLVETAGTTRGIHYDLGDMVTIEYGGKKYDVRLDLLHVAYANGALRTKATFRGTL